jgi:hypothetical protein
MKHESVLLANQSFVLKRLLITLPNVIKLFTPVIVDKARSLSLSGATERKVYHSGKLWP